MNALDIIKDQQDFLSTALDKATQERMKFEKPYLHLKISGLLPDSIRLNLEYRVLVRAESVAFEIYRLFNGQYRKELKEIHLLKKKKNTLKT